jgi:hypothetical protein
MHSLRVIFLPLAALLPVQASAADSLCLTGEQTLFSCRIAKSSNQVALCAAAQLDETGWLLYRFGVPGKIALEFPEKREGSLQRFGLKHYMRYQTDYTDIAFNIGKTQYSVYDYYQGEEKPAYARGVRVTSETGKETDLPCRGKVKSDLLKLEGLLPCTDPEDGAGCI